MPVRSSSTGAGAPVAATRGDRAGRSWARLLDGAAVGGEDGGRERVRGAGRSSVADDVSIGDPDSSAPAN